MKNNIYNWIWKWHFLGGLISLPIVILLSVTGIIYLFKDDYEKSDIEKLKKVEIKHEHLSFQAQLEIAQKNWDKKVTAVILPKTKNEATQFVSGRFSHKSSLFIDPYSGNVTGKIIQNQTDMHKVRKLHGELLLGKYGTKVVELVASWMFVLILTGVYIFYPRDRGWRGLFTIQRLTKRMFYRDLHAVTGFWFSILLVLILMGGMPWTDVFGTGFKSVQKMTNTGFPASWQGRIFESKISKSPLLLDEMMTKAESLNLVGEISITLPKSPKGIYSVSNRTRELTSMQIFHFDQYTGKLLHHGTWNDIGILMQTRLWVMAFHQGQFGLWNWLLVLITALALTVLSISAIVSYLKRKPKNSWGVPPIPAQTNIGVGLIGVVILLGFLLPLFGLSVILILVFSKILR